MRRCEGCERRAKAIAEWMDKCREWAKHPFGPMPEPPKVKGETDDRLGENS